MDSKLKGGKEIIKMNVQNHLIIIIIYVFLIVLVG